MKKMVCILTVSALLATSTFAQSRQAIVRIAPFKASGVALSEAAMLERLVMSYIVELKTFRVIDAEGQDSALLETEAALSLGASPSSALPLSADFIISGTIGKIGDIFVFNLDNTRVSSGEKLSVSDTSTSISDIALGSRSLTRTLFGAAPIPSVETAQSTQESGTAKSVSYESPETNVALSPTVFSSPRIADVLGTWRGEKGLETIRVFPNATALAILSGGGTLKLRVLFSGDTVEMLQDQPNDVAMYRAASIPFETARQIAAEARPMRWVFSLSPDGMTLYGIKESIAISGAGGSISIDNDYVRSASWDRISR